MDPETDYETPDGSRFSLREVFTERDGEDVFDLTTVSANIDGVAYFGKLHQRRENAGNEAALKCLELVPPECIYPPFSNSFTIAPEFNPSEHFLKHPQYAYDDCQPGQTFVADCVLNEITVLEFLKQHPHPNIVSYHGCVVKDGLVTQLCLKRYPRKLKYYKTSVDYQKVVDEITAAVDHLHSLGLAHNDVNPENVCLDDNWNAVLVDFDGCVAFGERLMKGVDLVSPSNEVPVSSKSNDVLGLGTIEEFLEVEDDRDSLFEESTN